MAFSLCIQKVNFAVDLPIVVFGVNVLLAAMYSVCVNQDRHNKKVNRYVYCAGSRQKMHSAKKKKGGSLLLRPFFTRNFHSLTFQIYDETNILQDGTLIDLCGATLLWRSAEGLQSSPVNFRKNQFNRLSFDWKKK